MPQDPELTSHTQIYGDYRVDFVDQPSTGSDVGGDVLLFAQGESDELRFFIADMAGSGRFGHDNWRLIEPAVQGAWGQLCESDCSLHELQLFGEAVSEAAFVAGTSLCAAAGRLRPDKLEWAGWGWGVHVLSSSTEGQTPLRPAALGWLLDRSQLSRDDITAAVVMTAQPIPG